MLQGKSFPLPSTKKSEKFNISYRNLQLEIFLINLTMAEWNYNKTLTNDKWRVSIMIKSNEQQPLTSTFIV